MLVIGHCCQNILRMRQITEIDSTFEKTFKSILRDNDIISLEKYFNELRIFTSGLAIRKPFFENWNYGFTQNFTFHTSHITHPKMYTLASHFSYLISSFTY